MADAETDLSRAGNGGSPPLVGRLPLWRRRDVGAWQAASLLGLLFSIQLCGAVLAPTVFMWQGRFNNDVGLTMFGAVSAASTLLALWAVFGTQRVAVRLPLTAWLMLAFAECFEYGAVLEHGPNDPGNIAAGLASLLAFFVMQLLLWPLRALGLWRLEDSANVPARASMKPASQFTVRGLLGWTLAVASLLGARRWYVPGGSFESNEWRDLLLRACAATLLMALVGLLVAALGWVLLADGRRPVLRTALCMLTLVGLAGGHWAFAYFEGFNEGAAYLGVGAVANALLSLAVVWVCGYRLTRRPSGWSGETTSAARVPIGGPRFALALAALLMPALSMAWYVPAFREHWRRVAISLDWQDRGLWVFKFDDAGEVTRLMSLGRSSISDDTLRRIAQLASLKSLRLYHLQIDDRQLALLAPLARRGLQVLDLTGTNITDAGLELLGRFDRLESLDLTNTQVSDAGLFHLRGSVNLRKLILELTEVTDDGLVMLVQLPKLETLDVRFTAVSSAAGDAHSPIKIKAGASDALLTRLLRHPKALNTAHRMTRLHARGKQVTDAGLIAVCAGLPELEELDLRDTAVTDQGLHALAALAALRKLDLHGSLVTDQGVAGLRAALPNCHITMSLDP